MNVKGILKSALSLLDSDKDGKLEISDVPGTIANIATMRTQGEAIIAAAKALYDGIKGAADNGDVTSGGVPVTPEQVTAAWDEAYAPFKTAKDEAIAAGPGQP